MDDAKQGDPYAKFILSHELGHIYEHDDTAKAFSEEESQRLTAWPAEELAEWQADTFADHLMLPWKFVIANNFDIQKIVNICNVERAVVLRQIAALRKSRRLSGDVCGECGNFTLVRDRTCLKCETCGSMTGRS